MEQAPAVSSDDKMHCLFSSTWAKPAPLEGVKSRKRELFGLEACAIVIDDFEHSTSSLKVTLESRIVAVGIEGRSLVEVLLEKRSLARGRVSRHEQLRVAHIGSHLAGASAASVEDHVASIEAVLREQPQVLVIDDVCACGDEAWAVVFAALMEGEAVRTFQGAVVVCVDDERKTSAFSRIERWTGAAGWLWQEKVEGDSLEILEDVLESGSESYSNMNALLTEASTLSQECFSEDCVEKCRNRGWVLTLLTEPGTDGTRSLSGFICLRMPNERKNDLHIARLAVPRFERRSKGCGQRLMNFALTKAARLPQSECAWISLSALDTAVEFYERYGFCDMTCDAVDDPDHFQTWMELANKSVVEESEHDESEE
eukprot:TRINITY_DN14163_c0_g2_i1.p1 TRINITY_DN14163_c0_g2~~TRINITY_DN14163_c0_g2_i1.p1  ORF type:complete len:371 (-),score=64.46 TRINITY_DN14163_c0_g2_i1:326-1438(-)